MSFLINGRFSVDSKRNQVTDLNNSQSIKIEPRLMRLLCLLSEHQGEIVSRQLIAEKIWDNYPSADEGINQAISFLRKLLKDERKEIIQTVPKTGYCLSAAITQEKEFKESSRFRNKFIAYVPLVLCCLLLVALYFSYTREHTVNSSIKQRAIRDEIARHQAIAKADSLHQAQVLEEQAKRKINQQR